LSPIAAKQFRRDERGLVITCVAREDASPASTGVGAPASTGVGAGGFEAAMLTTVASEEPLLAARAQPEITASTRHRLSTSHLIGFRSSTLDLPILTCLARCAQQTNPVLPPVSWTPRIA
jgi:hypothetical protein